MTVISRQPISLNEAISLINSVLKEKGLTTVLQGKTLKVVTLEAAKLENVPVMVGREADDIVASDNVVTYVVPVAHVTASALKENLSSLIPEYASLEANEDGNALIITDTVANIKRLIQIVQALDTHMSRVAEIRDLPPDLRRCHQRGQSDQQRLPAGSAEQLEQPPGRRHAQSDGNDDADARPAWRPGRR